MAWEIREGAAAGSRVGAAMCLCGAQDAGEWGVGGEGKGGVGWREKGVAEPGEWEEWRRGGGRLYHGTGRERGLFRAASLG